MQSVYEHAPPRAAHNHATTYTEKHATTHATSTRTREPPTTAHRENANESISVIAAPLEFALYKRTSGI